jgi:hypothetical protein
MKKPAINFHISIRTLMLSAASAVLLIVVASMYFTKHVLNTVNNQLAVKYMELAQQVDQLQAIKVALLRLEAIADTMQTGNPPTRIMHAHLQSHPFELAQAMMRFQGGLDVDAMPNGQAYARLAAILERLSHTSQLDHLHSAEAHIFLQDVQRALRINDDLSVQIMQMRNEHYRLMDESIQQHERELSQLGLALALVICAILWIVYSLSVSPLHALSKLASSIGNGTSSVESLSKCKVTLSELSELRDLIRQMVLDLTTSNSAITSNATLMLQLTEQSSSISSRVRGGVIEESAISKDIFGDLREMRLGNQQMQDALDRSLEILAGASSMDCIPVRDLDILREHLHLLADISNGWSALGEDLSRVLDGFDDMVRDRMTSAAELERLTKEMAVCAHRMAIKTA